ncbi:MAG: hypothetical protein ACRC67_44985 [Inquilinus sp.]|uniref:hypothetical protein n=1 Tax=Inquilinus sp. TaxID=1932117 RepID=UPI003F319718
MAFFPPPPPTLEDPIRAQARGQHVVCALFVTFFFKGSTLQVWEGDGPISRGGVEWLGMGQRVDGSGNPLQSIDGLEQAANGTAPQLSLRLNGVDSTVVTAAKSTVPDEIEGRDLTVQIGFYDATIPGALVPLGDLLTLGLWTMQKPSFTATGPTLRTITLPCETLFAQRSRAPFGMLTDRDQQRRFPGDLGCQFPPKLVDRDVAWPRH